MVINVYPVTLFKYYKEIKKKKGQLVKKFLNDNYKLSYALSKNFWPKYINLVTLPCFCSFD